MQQYGWSNCPAATKNQVNGFAAAIERVLGSNLIGIYLHGSLAMGCFNPERSDIDLLVVHKDGMSAALKREVVEILLERSSRPHPIEISFLTWNHLHPWSYPTLFDLHYGEDWREKYRNQLETGERKEWGDPSGQRDPDLAAHITIVRHRGVCLVGEPVCEVFPDVPSEHYFDSIWKDFTWARDRLAADPVYAVLNMCRVYWYAAEGKIASKAEGGAWAVKTLGQPYANIAARALAVYQGEESSVRFKPEEVEDFAGYLAEKIGQLRWR